MKRMPELPRKQPKAEVPIALGGCYLLPRSFGQIPVPKSIFHGLNGYGMSCLHLQASGSVGSVDAGFSSVEGVARRVSVSFAADFVSNGSH